jgi:hypothetical protein
VVRDLLPSTSIEKPGRNEKVRDRDEEDGGEEGEKGGFHERRRKPGPLEKRNRPIV